ncbi:MAG TPA: hypothetical protein VL595_09880 [Pseudonocardia sp.]|nr:hypothetical protein [Pseudonocardia sp.]
MVSLDGGLHGAHLRANVLDQIGPAALRRALRDRTLATAYTGVVVDPRRQQDLLTRCAAVVLAFGPQCALGGPTAAELHGCGAAATARTHVLMPYGSHQRSRPGLVVQRSAGYQHDVVTIDQLPVAALDRVVAEMLCRSAPRDALAVCDQSLALQPEGARAPWRARVGERIGARSDPRGTRRAQELLAIATGSAESPAESWLRLILIDQGFPWPEANWPLYSPWGDLVCRLDLAWPHLRIAVEYQGYAVHVGRDHQDSARLLDVERRGWIVVTAQAADLRDHHDLSIRLSLAFEQRGHAWRTPA